MIETIPKRGYRLIPEAKPISGNYRKWVRVAIFVATAISAIVAAIAIWPRPASIRSIAVLPFRNLSGDPAEDSLAAGITYSETNQLAQISALRVISYTSAMTYEQTKKSLRQVAGELKVDAVVEGAVLRSGAHSRRDPVDRRATGTHVVGQRLNVDQSTMIGLAGESARQIATALRIKLSSQEEARLGRFATSNPAAYEAYLKGRYFWAKYSPSDWDQAAELFQRALGIDPDYADAYVGLANCYVIIAGYGGGHLYMGKAKTASIAKALSLHPSPGKHTSHSLLSTPSTTTIGNMQNASLSSDSN